MIFSNLQIITVVFNHSSYLEKYFQSFLNVYKTIPCPIHIIDNNSQDNSYQVLQKWHSRFPQKIFLQQSLKNTGFSKANNQLVAKSQSKFILFLNPDISFSNDFISPCLQKLSEKNICLSPSFKDPQTKQKYNNFDSFYDNFFYIFNKVFNKFFTKRKLHLVDWIQAACLFLSRESFQLIDGFNEEFFVYTEDMYLAKKLNENNIFSYIDPTIEVFHPNRQISNEQFLSICKNLQIYNKEFSIKPYLGYLYLLQFFKKKQPQSLKIWKQVQNEKHSSN
ncbi:MAG: hypothetical protein COB02_02750 [Candidatus Cloacimonadota bacterium]|nr:MAG: hypothetical protein COB02_02750 [Candidatus Cloacimonadota bacterium]